MLEAHDSKLIYGSLQALEEAWINRGESSLGFDDCRAVRAKPCCRELSHFDAIGLFMVIMPGFVPSDMTQLGVHPLGSDFSSEPFIRRVG